MTPMVARSISRGMELRWPVKIISYLGPVFGPICSVWISYERGWELLGVLWMYAYIIPFSIVCFFQIYLPSSFGKALINSISLPLSASSSALVSTYWRLGENSQYSEVISLLYLILAIHLALWILGALFAVIFFVIDSDTNGKKRAWIGAFNEYFGKERV
ncbi:MAG: hypothetical protein ING44_05395 [Telmatospirillum sp.]|nr:hypothetical protein [Telmatospirillum sp.]